MRKRLVLALVLLQVLIFSACTGQGETKPLILIYAPATPEYGNRLAQLIEEDQRIDAEVQVVESSEVFRVKMCFPNVKVVVLSLYKSLNEGLGPTLEWYFNQGGGMMGLGFASSRQATLNASAKVFPAFGSSYISGFYDAPNRRFLVAHIKDEDDEISAGIGDFNISDHKVILSFNSSSNTYLPKLPEEGDYKVLFREEETGAPTMIKYENVGVSITFACFGGDDFERGASYHGRFTGSDEFIELFTNSVVWLWNNEGKYEESMQRATQYFAQQDEELEGVLQRGRDLEKKAESGRTLRTILILVFAGLGTVAVYWATFVRKPEVG